MSHAWYYDRTFVRDLHIAWKWNLNTCFITFYNLGKKKQKIVQFLYFIRFILVFAETICNKTSFSISGGNFLHASKSEDKKIVDSIVNEIKQGKVLRRLSLRKKEPVPLKLNIRREVSHLQSQILVDTETLRHFI